MNKSEVNKFEQVSSGGHQISLVGGGGLVLEGSLYSEAGALYSQVQCFMGNGHMGHPQNRLTDRLRWLAQISLKHPIKPKKIPSVDGVNDGVMSCDCAT